MLLFWVLMGEPQLDLLLPLEAPKAIGHCQGVLDRVENPHILFRLFQKIPKLVVAMNQQYLQVLPAGAQCILETCKESA